MAKSYRLLAGFAMSLLSLFGVQKAQAVGPIIQYVQVSTTSTPATQPGAFNMSSGTVSNAFSLPYLTPGLCTTTDSNGKVISTACGSGGGGGGSGTVGLANQYQVPFYSSSGSSNTLAGSNDISAQSGVGVTLSTVTASSASVSGLVTVSSLTVRNTVLTPLRINEPVNAAIKWGIEYDFLGNTGSPFSKLQQWSFGTTCSDLSTPTCYSAPWTVVDSTAVFYFGSDGKFFAPGYWVQNAGGSFLANRYSSVIDGSLIIGKSSSQGYTDTQNIGDGALWVDNGVTASSITTSLVNTSTATISSMTVTNITINGACTGSGCGSGGSSSLEMMANGVRVSSPTPSGNLKNGVVVIVNGFSVGGGTATYTFSLDPNATNYIQNTQTLQSGATYYVSSGTVKTVFYTPKISAPGTTLTFEDISFGNKVTTMQLIDGLLSPGAYILMGDTQTASPNFQNVTGLSDNAGAGPTGIGNELLMNPSANTQAGFTFLASTTNNLAVAISTKAQSGPYLLAFSTWGAILANGSYGASNQVLGSGGSGASVQWVNPTGGGGASTLAVTTGTAAGFSSIGSSPTAVLNLDNTHFTSALAGGATAYVTLTSSQNFTYVQSSTMTTSSFTVTGPADSEIDGTKSATAYSVLWSSSLPNTAGLCTVWTASDTVAGISCGNALGNSLTVSTLTVTSSATFNQSLGGSTAIFYSTAAFIGGYEQLVGTPTLSNILTVAISTSAPYSMVISTNGLISVIASSNVAYEQTFSSSATGAYHLDISTTGHINSQVVVTASPTLTSCGTSPSIYGNDNWMTVTAGSAATGCTITFANKYKHAPSCLVTNQSMSVVNAMTYTVSTTQVVVSQTGLGGDILNVFCGGFD